LDRAVANGAFSAVFDDCSVENIITTTSDHYAVLVRLQCFGESVNHRPVQSGFKYEAAWLRAPDYCQTMEQAWSAAEEGPGSLHSTWARLHSVADSLQEWSRVSFGSVRGEIKKLERQLKNIRLSPWHPDMSTAARKLERRLCELFEREEIMARQRSRSGMVTRGAEGDRNTAFFHARASARRRTNRIRALVREDGSRCEDLHVIKGMAEDFYVYLFTSEPFDPTAVILFSPRFPQI
jgi:hypothetical protein